MPVCAIGKQQPDGTVVLVLDPLATNFASCTYVVETGSELSNSLLNMTAQDGAIYSGGIISVWLAAYFLQSIIQVIKGSTNE